LSATPTLRGRFAWRGRAVAWDRVGSGPDVVLCHGTPWSSALWWTIVERLAPDFTVRVWDMPGYGQSSKHPEHPVDLGVQGELFADLLGHWGLDRPHVVAHDIGGAVTLRARLLHGAAYASLALVDVVALRPWGSPFFRLVQQHADVFLRLPGYIHRGVLDAYVRGASHVGLNDAQLETLVGPWLDEEGQAAFYRHIAQADERFTEEVEPLLGGLGLPVHLVWGREDTWIPPDRAERLAAAIPGATMRVLDGAGHLIQYDAPDALHEELATWLAERAGRPS
jgi:pimeloyl-ACP methyl ester carboxylesterase